MKKYLLTILLTVFSVLTIAQTGTGWAQQRSKVNFKDTINLGSGLLISGTIQSPANWNTAYTDRLKWDGGATGLVAATGRTSLGGTTIGQSIYTLVNPSAITFLRINADNSVSALSAANQITALGATTVGGNLFTLPNPSAITFPRFNADNTVSALSAANFKTALSLTSSDVGLGNLTNKLQVEAEDSVNYTLGYTSKYDSRFLDATSSVQTQINAKADTSLLNDTVQFADELFSQQEIYNVKDYGAVGDGVTDDAIAINATITAACAGTNAGGTIYFPVGVYIVNSTITVDDSIKIVGAGIRSTTIKAGANSMSIFTLNGVWEVYISDMTISGQTHTAVIGAEFKTAECVNIYFDAVDFRFLDHGIYVSVNWTHGAIEKSYFIHNVAESILIADGALQTNSILCSATRFEQTDSCHFRSENVTNAIGGWTFNKCVFESSSAIKSVDLGTSAREYNFIGCHFENNALTKTTGYDIYLSGGTRNINIEGCLFASMAAAITNGYGIYCNLNASNVYIKGCNFTDTQSGYHAIGTNVGTQGIMLINNTYPPTCVADYIDISNTSFIARTNDGLSSSPLGNTQDMLYAYGLTTNATPASIWRWQYVPDSVAVFIIADVMAVSDSGAMLAAYTRKILANRTSSAIVINGTDDETTIETSADWDCAFSEAEGSYGGYISLDVTGRAATRIRWLATIKVIAKHWTFTY